MNLKIIFLCINTVTAVAAHNHLRHKPEQNQITSFQNTKGELSRLLLLKGSGRLLPGGSKGSKDLGKSCDGDEDCGKDMECGSKDKCVCDKKYEEVDGKCVKEDTGGSGEAVSAAQAVPSRTDQTVLECFDDKDRAKDALDEDDEDKVEENLLELITTCAVDKSDEKCVEECIEKIVKECKDDLKGSKDGTGGSKDYDDCKHLDNDLIKCLERDCYQ